MTTKKFQASWRLTQVKNSLSTRDFIRGEETIIDSTLNPFQEPEQAFFVPILRDQCSEPSSMNIDDQDKISINDLVEPRTERKSKDIIAQEFSINSQFSSAQFQSVPHVDALYELPSEGEWEELILPRSDCQGFYFFT
jgi:hypothetical protein